MLKMLSRIFVLLLLSVSQVYAYQTTKELGSYFDQFLYTAEGSCKEIDSVYFRSTNSWEPARLGLDSNNRPVIAILAIQLFAEGKYFAQYEERAIVEETPETILYEILFTKALSGQWLLSGNELQVQGLGTGTPDKTHFPEGADGIKFQMNTVLNDKRVLSNSMNISRSLTSVGPNGVSIEQYCGVSKSP